MTKAFSIGDKVFAKVRGYPAWPARIENIIDGPSNRCKYNVFFYGTSETAVCKVEDIFHYQEFKEKYGKPLKRRGFTEALMQIEEKPGIEVSKKEDSEDSDEGKLIIDEDPDSDSKPPDEKKKGIKRKRENGYDHLDDKSANGSVSQSSKHTPVSSIKRFKKGSIPQKETNGASSSAGSSDSSARSSPFKPEIVSRSGRKIKPKKFADEEVFNCSASSIDADVIQKPHNDMNDNKMPQDKQLAISSNVGPKKQSRLSVKTPAALNNSIPACSTSSGNNNIGNPGLPEREKAIIRDKLVWLRIEAAMLEIESKLRTKLGIKKANTAESVILLNKLSSLNIQPLMLKKHPAVLKTMKKLRKYVGNTSGWNLTETEERAFQNDASQIRNLCDSLYNKFRDAFNVPDSEPFWNVFSERVKEFKKKTESLDIEKLCALTVDPTLTSDNVDNLPNTEQQQEVAGLQDQAEPQEEVVFSQSPPPLVTIKTEPLDTDEDSEAPKSPLATCENTTAIGNSEVKIEVEKDKDSQTLVTVKIEKEGESVE